MVLVRRVLAGVAAFGLATGGFVLGATQAQAASLGTWYFSGTFFTQNPSSMTGSQPLVLSGQTGDTFMLENRDSSTITLTNASGSIQRTTDNQTCSSTSCALAPGNSASFRILSAGDVTVTGGSGTNPATITLTVTGGGGSSSTLTSGPSPVIQQFPKPTSGSCDAAQPSGLDWSGVSSGGWSQSWAQWVNGGAGGAVCTRTLTYSTSRLAWVVD